MARRRLDALQVELAAARTGTYLGDNYNDVPSSFQRARDLALRIDETQATLNQLTQKLETIKVQLVAEERRLATRSSAQLAVPVSGDLWMMQAASGEYVRKGQDLLSVVDCSTAMVTASVSEREFNQLRIGDPVRFRVSGSSREYVGLISKLGLTSAGASFAISPEERHYQVAVTVAGLSDNADDRCAVGRVGQVIFDSPDDSILAQAMNTLRRALGLS